MSVATCVNAGNPNEEASTPSKPTSAQIAAALEQVERITADPLFKYSKRYSSLLRFIVARTLKGEYETIKERIIGIELFGKPPDFDASLDSTIRVAAAEVRKRLNLYYKDPAHETELRIRLPKRSYVADFQQVGHSLSPAEVAWQRPSIWLRILAATSIAILLALVGWGEAHRIFAASSPIEKFWHPLITFPAPIAISVGSGKWSPLPPASAKQESSAQGQIHADFPFNDLRAAAEIVSFLSQQGKKTELQFAQTTTLDELKGQPVVLLGSHRNDWAVRLTKDYRFQFLRSGDDNISWIKDTTNPSNQNWRIEESSSAGNPSKEYALVTRAIAESTGQWWVGIAGLTGAGTVAAQQMLVDRKAMDALVQKLPKGWENKNLQIVLEIPMVDGSPGAAKVIGSYCW